jgi:hypothetical protein
LLQGSAQSSCKDSREDNFGFIFICLISHIFYQIKEIKNKKGKNLKFVKKMRKVIKYI